jgi:hypothetical protein
MAGSRKDKWVKRSVGEWGALLSRFARSGLSGERSADAKRSVQRVFIFGLVCWARGILTPRKFTTNRLGLSSISVR